MPPYPSEDRPQFPGSRSWFTNTLEFINPEIFDGVPVYRVMDRQGNVIDSSQDPQVGSKTCCNAKWNVFFFIFAGWDAWSLPVTLRGLLPLSIVMWIKTGKLCSLSPENGQLSIKVKYKRISDAIFCWWKFRLHHFICLNPLLFLCIVIPASGAHAFRAFTLLVGRQEGHPAC